MDKFQVTLSDVEIAGQIASLLNTYNKLYKYHNSTTILNDGSTYFIELYGNKVVGCAGLIQTSSIMSKIHHISVRPDFRKRGLSKKLLAQALNSCKTENVFMTIREDNIPSLGLAVQFYFAPYFRSWRNDHYVITAGRRINKCTAMSF